MKLSKKKIFSIVIAGLALLLFIDSFIPHVKVFGTTANIWKGDKASAIFLLINYIAIIAMYLLNLFGIIKEKWIGYVRYAVGYICISYVALFFSDIDYLYVGIWFGVILSIAMATFSVLWDFASDEVIVGNKAPITGYDPKTGAPIYAKPAGYDTKTGKPIYK